jgi:hypothetical protein
MLFIHVLSALLGVFVSTATLAPEQLGSVTSALESWGVDELDECIATVLVVGIGLAVLRRVWCSGCAAKNANAPTGSSGSTGGNTSAVVGSLGGSAFANACVRVICVLCFFVGLYTESALASSLLIVAAITVGHKGTGYNWKGEMLNHACLAYSFVGWNMTLLFMACYVMGLPYAAEYAAITPCLTFLVVLGRTNLAALSWGERLVVKCLWDPPLLLACAFVHHVLRSRLMHDGYGEFLSLIDEEAGVCMSSFPFASDAQAYADAGVGTVINMCAEYAGPEAAYAQLGIVQHRFKVTDLACPPLHTIRQAVLAIQQAREAQPDRKVVVHCKGGRARASAVVLCYLASREQSNRTGRAIVKGMQEKRHVVERVVLSYGPVWDFIEECGVQVGLKHIIKQPV